MQVIHIYIAGRFCQLEVLNEHILTLTKSKYSIELKETDTLLSKKKRALNSNASKKLKFSLKH